MALSVPHVASMIQLSWGGQCTGTHEILIDGPRGTAAFVDGPYHERLAATAVASGKDSCDVGRKRSVFGLKRFPVAAGILHLQS